MNSSSSSSFRPKSPGFKRPGGKGQNTSRLGSGVNGRPNSSSRPNSSGGLDHSHSFRSSEEVLPGSHSRPGPSLTRCNEKYKGLKGSFHVPDGHGNYGKAGRLNHQTGKPFSKDERAKEGVENFGRFLQNYPTVNSFKDVLITLFQTKSSLSNTLQMDLNNKTSSQILNEFGKKMHVFQQSGWSLSDSERAAILDLYVVMKGCRKLQDEDFSSNIKLKTIVDGFKELTGQFKRDVRAVDNEDGTVTLNVEGVGGKPETHWTSYLDDVLLFDAHLEATKPAQATRSGGLFPERVSSSRGNGDDHGSHYTEEKESDDDSTGSQSSMHQPNSDQRTPTEFLYTTPLVAPPNSQFGHDMSAPLNLSQTGDIGSPHVSGGAPLSPDFVDTIDDHVGFPGNQQFVEEQHQEPISNQTTPRATHSDSSTYPILNQGLNGTSFSQTRMPRSSIFSFPTFDGQEVSLNSAILGGAPYSPFLINPEEKESQIEENYDSEDFEEEIEDESTTSSESPQNLEQKQGLQILSETLKGKSRRENVELERPFFTRTNSSEEDLSLLRIKPTKYYSEVTVNVPTGTKYVSAGSKDEANKLAELINLLVSDELKVAYQFVKDNSGIDQIEISLITGDTLSEKPETYNNIYEYAQNDLSKHFFETSDEAEEVQEELSEMTLDSLGSPIEPDSTPSPRSNQWTALKEKRSLRFKSVFEPFQNWHNQSQALHLDIEHSDDSTINSEEGI